jgi:ribosomal protein S18 acetylase RimI-like enzyme
MDAAGIARVHVDTWRTSYQGIVPTDFLAGLSYERRQRDWEQMLGRSDSGEAVYVAETAAGEIVAFAAGGPERSGDPLYRGEIYALYILREHQRAGIGRRLMGALAAHLANAGIHSLLLWVLAVNTSARRFYAALGGLPLREQTFELGGATLVEVAYGWPDTSSLTRKRET